MYRALRALLFLLPAETAHAVAKAALKVIGRTRTRPRLPAKAGPDLSVSLAGLHFPNPIGLAAGFDKDAELVDGLFALGFGGVEVGTVTPRPQPGNPRPRLFRLPEQQALINRMGFNNQGASAMAARLRRLGPRAGPLGVNIGKNKDTPNERAAEDYVACVRELADLADYVAVNASSPNTPGLRELQEPEVLRPLLTAVRQALDDRKPLFLKIAPDLSAEAIRAIIDVAIDARVDALICTNTTVQRPVPHPRASEAGGLSGAPLRPLSDAAIRTAFAHARGRLPIVGAGGVFTAEDAYAKILAGASFVQVYTGFIYEGPRMVPRLLDGLAALLTRDGFPSVASAVGTAR